MGNLFQTMFTYLNDALAAIIAVYAGVVGWISGPLRVGVTIYIILLGFAILRGAVEYPFREFVYRGMKLAALVFAVTTLYGASTGLFAMDGLPRDVAQAVGGSDVTGLGDFFDQIVRGASATVDKITQIQDARTAAAGKNIVGLPNNIVEIFFTGIYCLVLMVMAILSAALGFTICAFALFALALLAAVGPIFVAALLFDSTRAFFFAWLGSAISYLMLVAFALLLTIFIRNTGEDFMGQAFAGDTNIPVIAIRAIAFYVLGFFFFLQIPGLAAGLGGGGASLATQFANAATGNIAPAAGRALSSAPGRIASLPFGRGRPARAASAGGGTIYNNS
ncbi:type IV secretion system protein VirB6 [Sphingobium yanoikuyae]|uniref:Type IV secretion system protein VirB6 n=1 Tax=Sphingobium yanoikuyae TaxID=13690 RepID=A0A177JMV2_SPHYA|nr:type IV secretion system protein [Sphingobium yanoikuyae]OAH42124.1 type IV secretion system protein VirB6 [Sphingobium yanoikuyae]